MPLLQVNVVINYDMPTDGRGSPDPETYREFDPFAVSMLLCAHAPRSVHRIGRTGRFGRKGISINFVHDRKSMEQMRFIENYFQRPITEVDASSLENIEKELKKMLS